MYEGRPLSRPDEDIFDQGLAVDLETLVAVDGCSSSSGTRA
jgi:hypothetical protein